MSPHSTNISHSEDLIPNHYIVVFHPQTAAPACESHIEWAQETHSNQISSLTASEEDFSALNGIKRLYKLPQKDGGWLGYSGSFDAATIREINDRDEVAYVEPDRKVYTKKLVSESALSWGLARISQRQGFGAKDKLRDDGRTYVYDESAGNGVTVYVVDTGIYAEHEDFGGRATFGYNAVAGSSNTDKNGHGTHCSGTIAGQEYGVAKLAKIVGVKVLGDDGSGSNSTVIEGLNWVAEHVAEADAIKKSVVSMSLGGSKSEALNSACAAIVALGIPLCVAAGNDNKNAISFSPASEPTAITVGATAIDDSMSYFSNYGSSVDIFAPGSNITSAWIDESGMGRNNLTNTISGTSMATPHVAGLVAYLISLEGINSPEKVKDRLDKLGTKGLITSLGRNSPNILAYNGVEKPPVIDPEVQDQTQDQEKVEEL